MSTNGQQPIKYGFGEEMPSIVGSAFEMLWNTRMEEAIEALSGSLKADNNIWVRMAYCECFMWQAMFSDSRFDENMALVSETEKYAMEVYNAHASSVVGSVTAKLGSWWGGNATKSTAPQAPPEWLRLRLLFETELVLAEIAGMYAAIHLKQESYLKGGYQGRRAWKWYEAAVGHLDELLKVKPDLRDSLRPLVGNLKFGMGMYHFMVSLVPPALQMLVSAVGFEGNRRGGMEEMQFALDSGGTRSVHANLFLTVIQSFFYGEKDVAKGLMDRMRTRYPNAGVLMAIMGFLVRNDYDNEAGAQLFRDAIAVSEQIPQFQLQCRYELANCDFFANRWSDARLGFYNYLTEGTSRNFKAFCAWKLGFCYWMTGERDRVAGLMKQLDQWVRPMFSFDKFAQRKAKEFLAAGRFDPFEEAAYAAYFMCDAGLFAESLPLADTAEAALREPGFAGTLPSGDALALLDHVRARAAGGMGDLDRCRALHERVIAADASILRENWITVMSLALLAELAMNHGTPEETLVAVKRVKSYKRSYDFDKNIFVLCVQYSEISKARIAKAKLNQTSSTK